MTPDIGRLCAARGLIPIEVVDRKLEAMHPTALRARTPEVPRLDREPRSMFHATIPRLAKSLIVATFLLGTLGCAAKFENRPCVGERFPEVSGAALDGSTWSLPQGLAGQPAILLVGYLQEAQFDADRWIFGLLQAQPPAKLLEVPTIPGLFPRLIGEAIDSGMRSGIPSEDWQTVVTLYGDDATKVAQFTGNAGGRNIRVLLLDAKGTVVWFHDRGFSAGKLLELDQAARALSQP